MAVGECEECGGQVSTKAAACPHCGYARKRWYSVFLRRWWFVPVIVVLVGFGVVRAVNQYAAGNVAIKQIEAGEWFPIFAPKNVVVQNDNWFAVKDAEITCTHKDKHGRTVGKNDRVIDYVIPAGDAVKFAKLSFGVDVNVDVMEGDIDILPNRWFHRVMITCEITDAKVASWSG